MKIIEMSIIGKDPKKHHDIVKWNNTDKPFNHEVFDIQLAPVTFTGDINHDETADYEKQRYSHRPTGKKSSANVGSRSIE
jgi:hypothetical protein